MKIKTEAGERHVLAITVDNEAGVLAKITGPGVSIIWAMPAASSCGPSMRMPVQP